VRQLYAQHGMKAIFRGMLTRGTRVTMETGLIFTIYEAVRQAFQSISRTVRNVF
jgi:hypothetical protein